MPLPDPWFGVFYDARTNGDLLFDMEADEFVDFVAERQDGMFLVAGAMFDLLHNGCYERFAPLVIPAVRRWPKVDWPLIGVINDLIDELAKEGVDEEALATAANNAIARRFGGWSVSVVRDLPPRLKQIAERDAHLEVLAAELMSLLVVAGETGVQVAPVGASLMLIIDPEKDLGEDADGILSDFKALHGIEIYVAQDRT